jgi:hypothetical protein
MNWWFNELDSLGGKKNYNGCGDGMDNKEYYYSNNKKEIKSAKSQQLEDLTDEIKQRFIRDYKACYNE